MPTFSIRKATIKLSEVILALKFAEKIMEQNLGVTEHRFKKILFGSIRDILEKESIKTVIPVKSKD